VLPIFSTFACSATWAAKKAVTNTFLVPLFAQLWGALFLDEHLTAFGAIGFALVLLAVALVLEIRPWRKAQA
jgi:drug/metabolite transporter (DMT)-like permease